MLGLSLVLLAATVSGHPTAKQHAHKQAHEARADVTVYDSSVTAPTQVPERVIWFDDADNPTSTATEDVVILPATVLGADAESGDAKSTVSCTATSTVFLSQAGATGTPEDTPPTVPFVDTGLGPVEPDSVSLGAVSSTSADEKSQSASSSDSGASTEATSSASESGAVRFPGVSYAPYRADHGCKTSADIEDDFSRFIDAYSMVRIYGTDCDQVPNVYRAAKAAGTKLFLGIWDLNMVEDEAKMIISGVDSDWDMVHTVSVGNELVNNGQATPEQVIQGVKTARQILRAAGYQGPVVTVDTFIAAEAHPELCDESDYCAVNAHAFFDSTISADQAGPWLVDTAKKLKAGLATPKEVVITETGWPTAGMSNGLAVPSMENQKAAIASINEAFAQNMGDVILFSAFNDLWKQKDAATFEADQFWGIDGAVSSCDE